MRALLGWACLGGLSWMLLGCGIKSSPKPPLAPTPAAQTSTASVAN